MNSLVGNLVLVPEARKLMIHHCWNGINTDHKSFDIRHYIDNDDFINGWGWAVIVYLMLKDAVVLGTNHETNRERHTYREVCELEITSG